MSLYTADSLIRKLILEAEDLTITPSPEAQEVNDFTNSTSPDQVASDMSQQAAMAAPATPGLQGSTLTMPPAQQAAPTISKTVINKAVIATQLAELKSIIVGYEKTFQGSDLDVSDANVAIGGLLSALVFHAEKLNAFMESTPGSETEQAEPMPTQAVAMPQEEIVPPEPQAAGPQL